MPSMEETRSPGAASVGAAVGVIVASAVVEGTIDGALVGRGVNVAKSAGASVPPQAESRKMNKKTGANFFIDVFE